MITNSDSKILNLSSYLYHNVTKDKIKLLKLLYIAFGYYGVFNKGEHLFSETIEAWTFGPVVRKVYDNFSTLSSIQTPKITYKQQKALDRVKKVYGDQKPFDLVNLVHKEGSPWAEFYEEGKSNEIKKEVILEHYRIILGTVVSLLSADSRRILEEFAQR